jgi:hypothetical protein
MLQFTGDGPHRSLPMLVLDNDAEREFDYMAGADETLTRANSDRWRVVSRRDDWAAVFSGPA